MTGFEFLPVAAVTVVSFFVTFSARAAGLPGRWLPVVAGASGLVLGLAGHFMGWFPADDPVAAAAVGVVSGFAATGGHQAFSKFFER